MFSKKSVLVPVCFFLHTHTLIWFLDVGFLAQLINKNIGINKNW